MLEEQQKPMANREKLIHELIRNILNENVYMVRTGEVSTSELTRFVSEQADYYVERTEPELQKMILIYCPESDSADSIKA